MKIGFDTVLYIKFDEHPVKDFDKGKVSLLDVTAEGHDFSNEFLSPESFSNTHYCYCLLCKLLDIPIDKLEQFLVYQLAQIRDPRHWLRHLETFIEINYDLLSTNGSEGLYEKLKELIRDNKYLPQLDTKGFLFATIKSYYNQRYDMDKVRTHLKELDSFEEELDYLTELKINFIRERPPFIIRGIEPFDKLLDLEINKVEKLKKCSKYLPSKKANKIPKFEKCNTTLTVPQLAYKFRVLYDLGIVSVRTKTHLFKSIAQSYSTKNQKDISWKSIKNNFDSPDPKAIDFWVSQFQHLAVQAKKDKDK